MGRKRKFENCQLEEITLQAIEALTGNGKYLRGVSLMDVYRFAKERYPHFEYTDASNNTIVRQVLRDYEEKTNRIYGINLKEYKGSINILETFDYKAFLRKNKGDLETALCELGTHINRLRRCCDIATSELKKTENLVACDETARICYYQEEVKRLQEQIKELKNENKELNSKILQYANFYKKLNERAGLLVIRETQMAKVAIPNDPENDIAKCITYLQQQMDNENILFFEKIKEDRNEQE